MTPAQNPAAWAWAFGTVFTLALIAAAFLAPRFWRAWRELGPQDDARDEETVDLMTELNREDAGGLRALHGGAGIRTGGREVPLAAPPAGETRHQGERPWMYETGEWPALMGVLQAPAIEAAPGGAGDGETR